MDETKADGRRPSAEKKGDRHHEARRDEIFTVDDHKDIEVARPDMTDVVPLPDEIVEMILGHLHQVDAVAPRWVSRQWRRCSSRRYRGAPQNYLDGLLKNGHIETAKWARAHGCPWTRDARAAAAHAGQVETLDWLFRHGCARDDWVCAWAKYKGIA
ncbi:F-box domain containing protein [Pandoravirus quercus]|uniref:F-box domain containing protein n=1 Tax=Pandoravirus quercus TaxID=2107709 RepID=A0A2U7UAH0_9VIRU|nr:F-box domain containing protein [Pandoravirus quercus]AVK75392.1 F-box domain containing protein [Pandoravirus quercus]